MTKKAKFKVKGYPLDLLSWFTLPGKRKKWIASGDPNLDTSDPVADLAKFLHPGLIPSRIVQVKEETPTSRTYTLEPDSGYKLPLFYAGQYISVKFSIDGKTVTRPYAISSAPSKALEDNRLDITLKKNSDGYVNTYVWDNWQVDTPVLFDAPMGHVYYNGVRDSAHVVGIAGGSGVTIFRSIMEDMLSGTGRPEKLTLLFGSRNSDDILFKDELDALAAKSDGRIKIIHVLSEPDEGWNGETGFLSADLIKRVISDYDSVSYYVSGPAALYDFIEGEFDKLDISPTKKRLECYGESANIARHKDFPKDQTGKTYQITVLFGIDETVIPASSEETIVVALERAGIAIDAHCRSGECGFCRSRLEGGDIWQRPESDGVRNRDKDTGYFHPCSAYPISDLRLRVFTRI
jgi:ferredoxin-NADP reductase